MTCRTISQFLKISERSIDVQGDVYITKCKNTNALKRVLCTVKSIAKIPITTHQSRSESQEFYNVRREAKYCSDNNYWQ